jgi:hypothetical protein
LDADQRGRLLDDPDMARAASGSTPEEFAGWLRRRAREIRDDDGISRLRQQRRANSLRSWTDRESGMIGFRGLLDPERGAALLNRINLTVDDLFHDRPPDDCPTDPESKQAHLRALALVALTEAKHGHPGVTEVIVVIDADTLLDNNTDNNDNEGSDGSDGSDSSDTSDNTDGSDRSDDTDSSDTVNDDSSDSCDGSDNAHGSDSQQDGTDDADGSAGQQHNTDDRQADPDPQPTRSDPNRNSAHRNNTSDDANANTNASTGTGSEAGTGSESGRSEPGRPVTGRDHTESDTGSEPGRPVTGRDHTGSGTGSESGRPVAGRDHGGTRAGSEPGRPVAGRDHTGSGTGSEPGRRVTGRDGGGSGVRYPYDLDVPVESIRRQLCTCLVTPVIIRDGVVLAVGRTRRLATRAQRRALRVMYRTCGVPGCQVPFDHCQPHHIQWWRRDGCTDLDNLLPLCNTHHHLVHEGGWQLQLQPSTRALTITLPDGTVLNHAPPTTRAG